MFRFLLEFLQNMLIKFKILQERILLYIKYDCRRKMQNFKWCTWVDIKSETKHDDVKLLEKRKVNNFF